MERFDEIIDKIPVTLVGWEIHSTSFNSVVLSLNESIFKITQYVTELDTSASLF